MVAKRMQGVHYDRRRGHFAARHTLRVVTPSQPLNKVSFQLQCGTESYSSHIQAAQQANEAIRILTDGRVNVRFTAQGVPYYTAWHAKDVVPRVRCFKDRVLDLQC